MRLFNNFWDAHKDVMSRLEEEDHYHDDNDDYFQDGYNDEDEEADLLEEEDYDEVEDADEEDFDENAEYDDEDGLEFGQRTQGSLVDADGYLVNPPCHRNGVPYTKEELGWDPDDYDQHGFPHQNDACDDLDDYSQEAPCGEGDADFPPAEHDEGYEEEPY